MRLSTKGRYATRAVLDIALHERNGPVTLTHIAQRQGLSKKYLGQIVPQLLASGILESMRGPQGGYVLGKVPRSIRVGDIIRTMEGSLAPVRCVDHASSCSRNKDCVIREVWVAVKESVESVLNGITIADLIKRHRAKEAMSR